jgi:ribosomal protein S18 acetylase RimI-like enzyme
MFAMLTLRPFEAADDDALISWVRSAEELLTFAGPELAWPLTTSQLQTIRARSDTTAWTAVLAPASAPVGHIELVIPAAYPRRGHLARVIIDPARRRSGMGRSLVSAALEEAYARGLDPVTLNVRRGNDAAISLYTALGFRRIDTRPQDPHVLRMVLAAGNAR